MMLKKESLSYSPKQVVMKKSHQKGFFNKVGKRCLRRFIKEGRLMRLFLRQNCMGSVGDWPIFILKKSDMIILWLDTSDNFLWWYTFQVFKDNQMHVPSRILWKTPLTVKIAVHLSPFMERVAQMQVFMPMDKLSTRFASGVDPEKVWFRYAMSRWYWCC